jgi:hypothetical protein
MGNHRAIGIDMTEIEDDFLVVSQKAGAKPSFLIIKRSLGGKERKFRIYLVFSRLSNLNKGAKDRNRSRNDKRSIRVLVGIPPF